MDDLTKAVYRTGCLIAAAQNTGGAALTKEQLVADANELFELLVPEGERLDLLSGVLTPPMDPEQEKAFLEDLRRRAAADKDSRDKEKMARAVAMTDEESMVREESEEELGTRTR